MYNSSMKWILCLSLILSFNTAQGNVAREIYGAAACADPVHGPEGLSPAVIDAEPIRCSDLTAGESRLVRSDMNFVADRLIRKIGSNSFQAVLNLSFVQTSGSMTPDEMLSRVRACLAEATPGLIGPSGEQLEILAATSAELSEIPAALRPRTAPSIAISNSDQAFSTEFPQNIKCATVVHEVLHILGLIDEYDATQRPEYKLISCRVLPVVPTSIMDKTEEAFSLGLPKISTCDCSSELCRSVMGSSNQELKSLFLSSNYFLIANEEFQRNCTSRDLPSSPTLVNPDRALASFTEAGQRIRFENRIVESMTSAPFYRIKRSQITCTCNSLDYTCALTKKRIKEASVSNVTVPYCPWGLAATDASVRPTTHGQVADNVLTVHNSPQRPSLLHPNHFERVIKGNCPGGSSNYFRCGSLAYIPAEDPACDQNLQRQCSDRRFFLGVTD
jgi:hypothetical protein